MKNQKKTPNYEFDPHHLHLFGMASAKYFNIRVKALPEQNCEKCQKDYETIRQQLTSTK